jgi:hypothetical protein
MLRDAMTEAEIVRAVQLGQTERLLDQIVTEAVRIAAYETIRQPLRRLIADGDKN